MTRDNPAAPHSSSNRPTRRRFLGDSGALAASLAGMAAMTRITSGQNAPAGASVAPVVLGVIGCGRRGTQLIDALSHVPGTHVAMVCDVDALRTVQAAEQVARQFGVPPASTSDDRDLFEHPTLHGVIIATPDHWHVTQCLTACAANKDVYVEAPLARYLTEAKAIAYAARKYQRVVQVGMQHRSSNKWSEAAGITKSGNLGGIAQTRTWAFARTEPIAAQPDGVAPQTLDYDRWLGPAAERPYNPVRHERPEHFWDYGGGEAARWSVHFQDLVHSAMRVTVPKSVVAVGGNYGLQDARETPDTLDAIFEYESQAGRFVHVFSMRLSNAYPVWGPAALPPASEGSGDLPARNGVQFFGSQRTLFVNAQRLLVLPADQESPIEELGFLGIGTGNATTRPAGSADPLTIAHVKEFVNCVRSRKQPSATVETAQWALFPGLAANIAYRVGRKLYINPDTLEFFTDPELKNSDLAANELSFRPHREKYAPPNV